ncbi:MAG: molybdopterin-guanine dinucleotide biosynthesis protein B [Lachnospiraceae bacterium]|nr:molybdopterin-guanine dinucleotide biosynthesis protein B [Lachnospiraceae bacterium]
MGELKHVLGFSGYSGSGKTTLIEKLIPLLRETGLRIAVLKHDGHAFEVDREGTDSARFTKAGAETVILTSADRCVRFDASEKTLASMIEEIRDADLILVEGYKTADLPQIGVTSQQVSGKLPKEHTAYLAVVTDSESQFGRADIVSGKLPKEHTEDLPAVTDPESRIGDEDKSTGTIPVFDRNDAYGLSRYILKMRQAGALLLKKSASCSVGTVILCGGRSTRMGQPKEEVIIPWDGRTMLDHICDEMLFFKDRYLSVRPQQKRLRPDYIPIPDLCGEIGPAGGIFSALAVCKTDGLLVLACDMPRYTRQQAEKLLAEYRGEDILILKSPGGLEPLASIYSKSVLPALYRMIADKNYRIRSLLDNVMRVRIVEDDDAAAYQNVNRPEEFFSGSR